MANSAEQQTVVGIFLHVDDSELVRAVEREQFDAPQGDTGNVGVDRFHSYFECGGLLSQQGHQLLARQEPARPQHYSEGRIPRARCASGPRRRCGTLRDRAFRLGLREKQMGDLFQSSGEGIFGIVLSRSFLGFVRVHAVFPMAPCGAGCFLPGRAQSCIRPKAWARC